MYPDCTIYTIYNVRIFVRFYNASSSIVARPFRPGASRCDHFVPGPDVGDHSVTGSCLAVAKVEAAYSYLTIYDISHLSQFHFLAKRPAERNVPPHRNSSGFTTCANVPSGTRLIIHSFCIFLFTYMSLSPPTLPGVERVSPLSLWL